jgi:peptidyl-prolyl cis-trans isomerase C
MKLTPSKLKNNFLLILYASCLIMSAPAQTAPTVNADTVLVSSAKVKVTKADLDAELTRIPDSDRQEFMQSRERLSTVVENLLINKTLAAEAKASGLDKQPAIQSEILNQTEKVLAKYRGQQILSKIESKDFTAAAREIYLTEPEKSKRPAKYKVWQILVTLHARERATAKKRAEEMRDRALKNEDLEALARKYSDDPSVSRNGGVLEFLPIDGFEPAFSTAVKTLKLGEVSDVVETRFGYHVLKLVEILPEKKYSFEEAKPELIAQARDAYLRAQYETHLNAIRLDSTVKLNTEALDAIRPKFVEPPKTEYVPPETLKAPQSSNKK